MIMLRMVILYLILLFCYGSVCAGKSTVKSFEEKKLLSKNAESVFSSIDKNVMPENMPVPLPVYVTVYVVKINKISERSETFEATIDLRLRWNDNSLKFAPLKVGTNRLEFDGTDAFQQINKMWNPAVIISNIVKNSAMVEPSLLIYEDGTVMYSQRISATFINTYSLSSFPFDTQHLIISLSSKKHDLNELNFNQEQSDIHHSRIDENASLPGWNINKLLFEDATTRNINGLYYAQFKIKIIAERLANGHILMLLPLFLLMVMPTILTLYINTDLHTRLTAWAGALLATVALSFTLASSYPELAGDSIISVLLQYCFLFQLIMIFITCTLFNPQITDKFNNRLLITEIHAYLKWSIPIIFALLISIRILIVLAD